jgi:chlorobactene glucosyltransferase
MTILLFALPWIGVLAFLILVVRVPRELPGAEALYDHNAPAVSVIVPARNEAPNIQDCLVSLTRMEYPDFEIIVVDDRSDDDTGSIARGIDRGNARRLLILDGEELPDDWLGKPWACWQGAKHAQGEVLLFTDADTTHGRPLLARAVAGLREEGADLLTVVGRQLMESFWEKIVQPQIFLMMVFRFPRFEDTARNGRWRDAIANGQYILMPRASYDAIGGHEAVQGEVAEDMALAQTVKRMGRQLRMRSAEGDFATRMYRSLPGLIEGWSKNITMGGLQSVAPAFRSIILPLSLFFGLSAWVAPPVILVIALFGVGGPMLLPWAALVVSISAVIFGLFTHGMKGPAIYGLLYPLGALTGSFIFLRSWIRGRNVEWKGRRYTLREISEIP